MAEGNSQHFCGRQARVQSRIFGRSFSRRTLIALPFQINYLVEYVTNSSLWKFGASNYIWKVIGKKLRRSK